MTLPSPPVPNASAKAARGSAQAGLGKATAQRGSAVSIVLACVALVLSLVALAWSLFHDPLGSGMQKYDFSTPENTYTSIMKMTLDQDVRAIVELQCAMNYAQFRERLRTYKVEKGAEVKIKVRGEDQQGDEGGDKKEQFELKKALFVSYQKDGKTRYAVVWFKQDEERGIWLPHGVEHNDLVGADPDLAREVREWERQ